MERMYASPDTLFDRLAARKVCLQTPIPRKIVLSRKARTLTILLNCSYQPSSSCYVRPSGSASSLVMPDSSLATESTSLMNDSMPTSLSCWKRRQPVQQKTSYSSLVNSPTRDVFVEQCWRFFLVGRGEGLILLERHIPLAANCRQQ